MNINETEGKYKNLTKQRGKFDKKIKDLWNNSIQTELEKWEISREKVLKIPKA